MISSTIKFVSSALFGLWLSLSATSQVSNQSRTFNVSDGGTLKVEVGRADIRIRTGSTGVVQVDGVGLRERDAGRLEMFESGGTVHVKYDGRGHFEIQVPTRFDLELHARSGDIQVIGRVDGSVQAHSASGDLSLEDVEGDVDFHTGGGDIEGKNVGGNATIETGGGDIGFAAITGDFRVATGGGDIQVGEIGGDLTVGTGAGDVEVGDVAGRAQLTTGGGDVGIGSVGGGVQANTAGGDVDLNGAQGLTQVTTAGGDLTLRNLKGSVKATTAGGDIIVDLISDGKGSTLMSAGGDITLYLDPRVGVTLECTIQVSDWDEVDRHEIQSDFPGMRLDVDPSSREIRGSLDIGGGGTVLTLKTIDGDIEVRRKGQ